MQIAIQNEKTLVCGHCSDQYKERDYDHLGLCKKCSRDFLTLAAPLLEKKPQGNPASSGKGFLAQLRGGK